MNTFFTMQVAIKGGVYLLDDALLKVPLGWLCSTPTTVTPRKVSQGGNQALALALLLIHPLIVCKARSHLCRFTNLQSRCIAQSSIQLWQRLQLHYTTLPTLMSLHACTHTHVRTPFLRPLLYGLFKTY